MHCGLCLHVTGQGLGASSGCLSAWHNLTLTICYWPLLTMTGHCHLYWHRRLVVTDNDLSLSLILAQETGSYWQWPVTVIDTGTGDGVTDNDRSLSLILTQETGHYWQWTVTVIDNGTGDWTLLTMTGHYHWHWHIRLAVIDNYRPT
jgi:hypothetical protein